MALPGTTMAARAVVTLDTPVAYCLTELQRCNPTSQFAMQGKRAADFKDLAGDPDYPVTLVFNIPQATSPHADGMQQIMVSASYTHFCFRFNTEHGTSVCVNQKTMRIPVPPDATQLYAHQIGFTDIRLEVPRMMVGTAKALQAETLFERDVIMVLVGWYALMAIGAAAQMLIRFNRVAALCMTVVALSLLFRTLAVSIYGHTGLAVFSVDMNRRIELLSLVFMCLCGTEFYAAFISHQLLKFRRTVQTLCVLVGISVVLVESKEGWYVVLRLVQLTSLISLACMAWQAILTQSLLDFRRRVVVITGLSFLMGAGLIDLSLALMSKPFIGHIGLLPFGFAMECLCQIILLALTNEKAQLKIAQQQQQLFAAQSALLESTRNSEMKLQLEVAERTAELQTAIAQLQTAHQESEQARKQAEVSKIFAEKNEQITYQTLEKLQHTQAQLIQAEKNASLGLLVSNVAHEINTPIGAVKSSGEFISDALATLLAQMPQLMDVLQAEPRRLFMQLITQCKNQTQPLSSREERALTKQLGAKLAAANVTDAPHMARLMMKLHAHEIALDYLPLFNHPQSDFILSAATGIADLINGTNNIRFAVEKVSRIVFALKSLSGHEVVSEMTHAPVHEGIDKVLFGFQGQMHSVQLIRTYHLCEPLYADHIALRQVWTHLIMNALQAVQQNGRLEVALRTVDKHIEIKVSDNGPGMPDEILHRIFDPFFTTRTSGEGSGMGLSIVKNIIEKHQGSIEVQTTLGEGSTFTVYLPYVPAEVPASH